MAADRTLITVLFFQIIISNLSKLRGKSIHNNIHFNCNHIIKAASCYILTISLKLLQFDLWRLCDVCG